MKISFIASGLFVLISLTSGQECQDGYFQCDNGNCVPETWICDGDNDCGDFSDEPEVCPPCPGRWQCANGNCITITYICDGDNDCGDGSDELDPATGQCPLCPENYHQCGNGRCVTRSSVCNGNNDCRDWSDETEEACPCSDEEVRCTKPPGGETGAPGACIPPEWICDEDGIWDCPNGDDEANCTRSTGFKPLKKARHFHLKPSTIQKSKPKQSRPHFWYKTKKN